jgi:hypothetical protein
MTIDWKKLPSSSSFNSLLFLNELSETVAMFGLKVLKQSIRRPFSAYGWMEFGYLPFLAELQSILSAISTALSLLRGEGKPFSTHYSPYLSIVDQVYDTRFGQQKFTIIGNYTCRFTGTIKPDLSGLGGLDLIGLHPDILTLWEAKPLSFLVDYFLPIGDFLDNFARGGWVSSARFTGFVSEKYGISFNSAYPNDTILTLYRTSGYTRQVVKNQSFPVKSFPKKIELEVPSFRQLFNAIYIAASFWLSRKRS